MVSWTCQNCNGSGKESVVIIRNGKVTNYDERCSECLGSGSIRNGEPEWTYNKWGEM